MILADIERIELHLGVMLPVTYRDFMLNYPVDLDEDIRTHDIYAEAEAIITTTEKLRHWDNPDMNWQKNYVVIGDSGSGDYYYIHAQNNSSAIYWWNQTAEELEEVAPSINDWYQDIIGNM